MASSSRSVRVVRKLMGVEGWREAVAVAPLLLFQ